MSKYIGNIAGVTVGSTIDWYGHTSIVFFFQGCNLQCPFCFNGKLISQDVNNYKTEEEIKAIIDENIVCDAVVVTGGEPMLQPNAVEFIFRYAKEAGLLTMLNTNGTISNPVQRLCSYHLIDHIALDVKAPLDTEMYSAMTGVYPIERYLDRAVLVTMQIVKLNEIPLEVRTTVVPGTVSMTEIETIIESIREFADEYHIQQYDNTNPYNPSWKSIEKPDYRMLVNMGKKAFDAGISRVVVKTQDNETIVFERNKKDNPYIVFKP